MTRRIVRDVSLLEKISSVLDFELGLGIASEIVNSLVRESYSARFALKWNRFWSCVHRGFCERSLSQGISEFFSSIGRVFRLKFGFTGASSPRLYEFLDRVNWVLGEAKARVCDFLKKYFIEKFSGLSDEDIEGIAYYIARDFVGYGKIDPLIRDKFVEDISCNGIKEPVYVFHRDYEWLETNVIFNKPHELERVVSKLALRCGQEISIARPVIEGVIKPEGYRVNLVLDVVSRRGHSFTIRKFRAEPFTIIELIKKKTINPLVAAYLWIAIEYKQGVVVYGPTGSGKTTLLNALALLLPPEYKIVTAEDTPEIMLPFHDNWMAMVTRLSSDPNVQSVTLQAQVEAALRQRPDVIILGEIRSREAYSFFQAVSTGHGGLTTVHAEDTETLINRLAAPPMNVPKSVIAAVKAFVFIARLSTPKGFVRKVIRIDEGVGYDPDKDKVILKPIIKWDRYEDDWYMTSKESAMLKAVCEITGLKYEEVFEDLIRRATVINWAVKRDFDLVMFHTIVRRYSRNPDEVFKQAVKEAGVYKIKIRETG
ncbi:type II/IV secretion system ATPase subunit [Desulfurococcaceae archaeon MEX13E-LK6-19]|nr:type II/IV secretion system ATPase subunit [Desulfurococcaceae archaeon MEX13E-LK6-19]